jgi:hypothetical protein
LVLFVLLGSSFSLVLRSPWFYLVCLSSSWFALLAVSWYPFTLLGSP